MTAQKTMLRNTAHNVRIEYVKRYRHHWSDTPDHCDLCGDCARASVSLFHKLASLGLTPTLVAAPDHVWVSVEGTFIDITATQFGSNYSPVHMGKGKPEYGQARWDTPIFRTQDVDELTDWLLSQGWPQEQVLLP